MEDADLARRGQGLLGLAGPAPSPVSRGGPPAGRRRRAAGLACDVVRLSCDGSLVRIVRQFDETRSAPAGALREEQATLAHQALHDQLTGLPNRTLLADRLRPGRRRRCRAGTGHAALPGPGQLQGHQRPVRARRRRLPPGGGGRALSHLVRAADTVARLGGDEFVVLAEDLDEPDAAARSLAERIHLAMRAPVAVGERQLYTSVSIGIAPVAPDADPEVCLAQADAAMYQAKRGGPARYERYNPVIGEDNRRREPAGPRTAGGPRQGRAVRRTTSRCSRVGRAASWAWRRCCGGTIPSSGWCRPVEFIPLLERSREIVPVGRWVLEEATRQCRDWQDQGHPELTVSVNVSARQLQDPGFYDDVQRRPGAVRLDPDAPGPRGHRVGPGGGHRPDRRP